MSKLKNRKETPQEFLWNTTTIFATDEAWQKSHDKLPASINKIEAYEGKLGESAETLLDCLTLSNELQVEESKILLYAKFKQDEDMTNPFYQAMADKAEKLDTNFWAAISFIAPEIISLGQDKINTFMNSNDDLKVYKQYFDNLLRLENHTLSPEIEKLLIKSSQVGQAGHNIFTKLNNTDLVFKDAKDSNGVNHEVNHANYSALMENTDRTLRENTFNSYTDAYIANKNTIATAYNYAVKDILLAAEVRKYDTTLDASLSEFNIPTSIYKNLINTVNDNIHIFHRYLGIRKNILKYDNLQMWDITVPIVENANTQMNWEDAKTTVIEGLAILGEEYQELLKKGFNENWVDVYGNKGKRAGAYAWGRFGFKHPYVLMNYDDTINGMFTLAHEMGHALHFHYAFTNQPAVYASYSVFTAEIASTVNEALLINHLLKTTTDKTKSKYLLNYFIQQFVQTFFRQAMLAEFEIKAHEMAEAGNPLTAESLSELYESILEKHNGTNITPNEKAKYQWSRIPHFYRNLYVYQYSTGFVASLMLAKKIQEEGAPAVEKYLNLLKSGCKDYPVDLLKEAGVDMTSTEPIKDALKIFEELLDKFEETHQN